jgi:hypothetical protein
MKRTEIELFEKTNAQLEGLQSEVLNLSRKSPNDAINKFKLGLINKTIQTANRLLGEQYRPFSDFSLFDENALPSNSDVTMILGQYLNCMEKLRADNIKVVDTYSNDWCWKIDGKSSDIATSLPKKLREGKK